MIDHAFLWLTGVIAAALGAAAALFRINYYRKPPEDVQSDPTLPDSTPPVGPPKLPPQPTTSPKPPSMPKLLYQLAKANIGKHITLNEAVRDEVGCCEAISFLLKKAGYAMPAKGIEGVNSMITWMLAKGFREVEGVSAPLGTIITAHSPDYYTPTGAHIGVIMQYGICSNQSSNGLWMENYKSIDAWRQGFPHSEVRFFVPV